MIYDPTLAGDPIEMGAAVEVFSGQPAGVVLTSTFQLASSKSWFGHAEPAAGVVGIAHTLLSQNQQARLPIMHLRTLNPLVGSVLEADAAAGEAAADSRRIQMSRQQAPMMMHQDTALERTGMSAFAFQVNVQSWTAWTTHHTYGHQAERAHMWQQW